MLLCDGLLISASIAIIIALDRPKPFRSAIWYSMPSAEEEPKNGAGQRTRILWVTAFAYTALVYSSVLQSLMVVPEIQGAAYVREQAFVFISQEPHKPAAQNFMTMLPTKLAPVG